MVCKENVVSWFGNLSSYKRIDVMCTLLNMCLPFEIRYLGTCVEDLGKRDYNDLRDTEHRANTVSELIELTTLGVTDKRTRRKLALYMALLHSCNYECAVILYKNLSNFDFQEITNLLNGTTFTQDDQPLEELLLLYTMALNHPAFTYEQKTAFANIYVKLQEEEARLNLSKSTYKPPQSCNPCGISNERLVDADIPSNCMMPPPPMQTYQGDLSMRGNTGMVTGVPPGLTMPPPGLCLPSPEQMTMNSGGGQYLHLGFPSMNQIPTWTTGQMMMGNQLMYHTGEILTYPQSPLVSRQSSPSQSRSPSRSNSPMGHRNTNTNSNNNTIPPRTSSQVTPPTSSTLTTSSSCVNNQTTLSSSNTNTLPILSSLTTSRNSCLPNQQQQQQQQQHQQQQHQQQSSLLPSRSVVPSNTTSGSYSRHNSIDNSSTSTASNTLLSKQPPPPPRLRSSTSGDSLRDSIAKDNMPNYKSNIPNLSLDEITRRSDEDLRKIGLPSNAGQLRSMVKSQTSNGLSPIVTDKKDNTNKDTGHSSAETMENEEPHQLMYHQNHVSGHVRRYPTMPQVDPTQMQMYPPPPPIYAPHNTPCYTCLTVPVAGMQSRFPRCNTQQVYCIAQLQALRLDPENSRHCSQSSSSESTGSRSPPETPPAAPWVGDNSTVVTDHVGNTPIHSSAPIPPTSHPQAAQTMQQQSLSEKPRNRKNHQHMIRHKNQMVNGGGCGSGGPPNLPQCAFPGAQSQLTYLPHGHFPTLRPNTAGIYSNFSHAAAAAAAAAYARPNYPTYQPNGEMIYPYPPGPPPCSGGTPPPPPPNAATPSQSAYIPATPVVTYSPAVPPAKISCYNCGSSSHLAVDCKDQTMEDLTKRAQYRIDYTIMKQPGECPNNDK